MTTRMIRPVDEGLVRLADPSRWNWTTAAACGGEDIDLFFGADGERQPEREEREQYAKEICAACPIRTECLDYAISRPEKYGIWGGRNEDERDGERRRRMRHANRESAKEQPKPAAKPKPKPKVARIDSTGTQRRLRALAVIGHGPNMIAARMTAGSKSMLGSLRDHRVRTVLPEVARQVADLYPILLETEPSPLSTQVIATARRHGWRGPEAWEGVDIDDPNAAPREVSVAETRQGREAIEQARRLLADAGISDVDIVAGQPAA